MSAKGLHAIWGTNLQNYFADHFGGKKAAVKLLNFSLLNKIGYFYRYKNIDWSQVSRLVFVCKGNICRSPYGHFYSDLIGCSAASFGLFAASGVPANPVAIKIARQFGVDLQDHTSFNVADFQVCAGDLFCGFEPWHCETLRKSFGERMGVQITLVGLWGDPQLPYIHDPYGLGDEYFRRCFSRIKNAVRNMVNLILLSRSIKQQGR